MTPGESKIIGERKGCKRYQIQAWHIQMSMLGLRKSLCVRLWGGEAYGLGVQPLLCMQKVPVSFSPQHLQFK